MNAWQLDGEGDDADGGSVDLPSVDFGGFPFPPAVEYLVLLLSLATEDFVDDLRCCIRSRARARLVLTGMGDESFPPVPTGNKTRQRRLRVSLMPGSQSTVYDCTRQRISWCLKNVCFC